MLCALRVVAKFLHLVAGAPPLFAQGSHGCAVHRLLLTGKNQVLLSHGFTNVVQTITDQVFIEYRLDGGSSYV